MPKKGAFFYFMLEYRKKQGWASGRNFRTLEQTKQLASKVWEHMNAKQREPYVQQASSQRKLTTQNQPLRPTSKNTNTLQNIAEEAKKDAAEIRNSVKERLRNAEMTEDGLVNEEFYIVSMAYFSSNHNGGYVPAELGMVKFNLNCGVNDKFHILINPGSIPIGMALEAKQHTASTHGLPLPPNALGVKDYDDISEKFLTFLQVEEEIPPLFTHAKDVAKVKNMLTDILGHHLTNKALKVSSVADLLFEIKQGAEMHMMSMTMFPSINAAQELIDDDPYMDAPNTGCEYHESHKLSTDCALSKCVRWASTICENCCLELAIDLIPGKHIPLRKKPCLSGAKRSATSAFSMD